MLPVLGLLCVVQFACDRNIEPYVPGEEPRQPDLSRIFPAGAEQQARRAAPGELPPQPRPRGAPPVGADARANLAKAEPIRGEVRVAEALRERLRPDAVLFIIARVGAAGPPLAVKRIRSPRFPLQFSIGPDDRMIATLPFQGALQLTARLDGDGDAISRDPGDLQGRADGTYPPGASNVTIVLDEAL
jgi:cytochrome c-type biogenesis protein CcmH